MKKFKICSCGKSYSREEFLALKAPARGDKYTSEDGELVLVFRNCVCGSTMTVEEKEVNPKG